MQCNVTPLVLYLIRSAMQCNVTPLRVASKRVHRSHFRSLCNVNITVHCSFLVGFSTVMCVLLCTDTQCVVIIGNHNPQISHLYHVKITHTKHYSPLLLSRRLQHRNGRVLFRCTGRCSRTTVDMVSTIIVQLSSSSSSSSCVCVRSHVCVSVLVGVFCFSAQGAVLGPLLIW
jgi:hypothetical protein